MKEQIQKPQTAQAIRSNPKAANQAPVGDILAAQRKKIAQFQTEEEDETLQGKFETAQREEMDEEKVLQGK